MPGNGFPDPDRRNAPEASSVSAGDRCCSDKRSLWQFSSSRMTAGAEVPLFSISMVVVIKLLEQGDAEATSRGSSVQLFPPPRLLVFVAVEQTAQASDTDPAMRRGTHSVLPWMRISACSRHRGRYGDRCKVHPRGHRLQPCQSLSTTSMRADEGMTDAGARMTVR